MPLVLVLFPFLGGASFRSSNFAVDAPSREVAERVAQTRRVASNRHRPGLARARVADLEHALPDPGQADRGRGRRLDLVRLHPGPSHRSKHDGRGAARSNPGFGLSPRGDAHDLRQLFRRSHAALGRRRRVALERRRPRTIAATTRSPTICWLAAAKFRSRVCS